MNLPPRLDLVLGLSYDDLDDGITERQELNPKGGLIWELTDSMTVRAAAFKTLSRSLLSSQTIEPTTVAGFNQFFDDISGTSAWRYGVAVDKRLSPTAFVGAELAERDLEIPRVMFNPDGSTSTALFDGTDTLGRLYAYWAPTDRLALSAEYSYERFERESEVARFAFLEITTHRVPLEARVFDPSGLFAHVRTTYVDQRGRFEDLDTLDVVSGRDRFWVIDAGVGLRFANQRGVASLEVRNLFDEDFRFQDVDPADPTLLPERTVLARLTLTF